MGVAEGLGRRKRPNSKSNSAASAEKSVIGNGPNSWSLPKSDRPGSGAVLVDYGIGCGVNTNDFARRMSVRRGRNIYRIKGAWMTSFSGIWKNGKCSESAPI